MLELTYLQTQGILVTRLLHTAIVVLMHSQNIEVAVQEVNENVTVARQDIAEVHKTVQVVRQLCFTVARSLLMWKTDHIRSRRCVIRVVTHTLLKKVNTTASFLSMYAKHAHYNTSEIRRSCLEGTRTAILDHIRGWIITASRKGADSAKKVFWICGLAGTGKTTVAHSIADWAEAENILGGDFFCSKFDPECNNPDLMFLTLSRQLCHFHAPFKEKIVEVLRSNPDVEYSTPDRQFEKLIVEPLEALDTPFPLCLIVIDALDECKGKNTSANVTSTVLAIIARFFSRISRFLIFVVTSRPEPGITALFQKPRTETLHEVTTSIELHMIEKESTRGDIKQCLVEGLKRVPDLYSVPQGWPPAEDVERLVELANGLFVFIRTAIAFVMDEEHCDPPGRLQHLSNVGADIESSGAGLYELYSEIIQSSHTKLSSELADRLQRVLGAIALAQVPLSVSALAGLVGLSEDAVVNTLRGLHSVLHIPGNRLDPILVIHPTFPEFLLRTPTPITSGAPATLDAFCIQPTRKHWFLFSQCLDAMSLLKRDMVGIRSPAKFKSEIQGFAELTRKAIPPHVRYASRYWASHFLEGLDDPKEIDVSDKFRSFMHDRALFWFEACLLLDIPAALALEAALSACRVGVHCHNLVYMLIQTSQTLGGAFAELAPLLTDCHRFMQTNLSVMLTAPLQLYHFVLSIAPAGSNVRALYSHELEHSIDVHEGAPSRWPPSLDTFLGHGGKAINSVAFSSDGSCFASGGRDNHVRIRDSASRTELQSFDGHTDWVNCVAFSLDGAYVASGSRDQTVCIWQMSSGARVHTLEGHTRWVYSVTYSADGRRVLSATGEGEVKLWDTADGRCVFALEKTRNRTWQAALSPIGDVIARGEEASLVLRDVASATHEALSLPDKVQACAFLSDGRYIAARTRHAIRVWATADKALVRSIDTPDSLTSRLAFSRDGKYIACGSESGTVYVWEVASHGSLHTLYGHTDEVNDVAWSPDGLQLASAAEDGTIRLWDGALHSFGAEISAASVHPPAPPGPPRFAFIQCEGYSTLVDLPSLGIDYFPADPRLPEGAPTVMTFTDVVAACDDTLRYGDDLSSSGDRARNWEFLTGQQCAKFNRCPVSISRDGSRLAYISPTSDKVVDVCDLYTGIVVATLEGHTEDVRSIVFSPDGTRLATGSDYGAVKVWNATTGALICGHAEHRPCVHATSFTSDGRYVASGSYDKTVRIFDVVAERVAHVLSPHNDWVIELMFTVDDEHVVTLDSSDQVTIWAVATGARTHSFSFKPYDWRHSLTFSSNTVGIRVQSDAEPRTIGLWKPRVGRSLFVMSGGWVYARFRETVHRLCWIPPEWGTVLDSDGETLRLAEPRSDGHPHGRPIVIDMSRMLAYVDSLGPDSS